MNSPVIKFGLLVIVWIVWYVFFYSELSSKIKEGETERESLRLQLSTLNKEKEKLSKVTALLEAKRHELENLKKRAIPGDNPQVVASNLQNLVLTYASKKDIDVLSYRTSASSRWKEYTVARTTFTFNCSKENFVELLRFFDFQKKLIRPSRVNIVWIRGKNSHIRVILDIEALFIDEKGGVHEA